MNRLATTFTGLKFVNPFILASAPPTESKRKILKATGTTKKKTEIQKTKNEKKTKIRAFEILSM